MKRFLLSSFVVTLLLALAAPSASAQQQAAWKQSIGAQLATHLNQPETEAQDHAMQIVVALSTYEDRAALNLRAAADPLLRIYSTASDANRRLMAVSALNWVDDPDANVRLLQHGLSEPDPRVRRAILYAVSTSNRPVTPKLAAAFNALRNQSGSALAIAERQ
jgi:HEAT repeat protein